MLAENWKSFLSCKNNAQIAVAWNHLGLALNEKFKKNLDLDSQIKLRVDRLKQEYRVCPEKFKKIENVLEEYGEDVTFKSDVDFSQHP
jgi:hypothetical protein